LYSNKNNSIKEICFLSNTFYCYILAEMFPKIHTYPRSFIPLVMYDKGQHEKGNLKQTRKYVQMCQKGTVIWEVYAVM
jgi:hypothetical protein